jgi:hypothetical protein
VGHVAWPNVTCARVMYLPGMLCVVCMRDVGLKRMLCMSSLVWCGVVWLGAKVPLEITRDLTRAGVLVLHPASHATHGVCLLCGFACKHWYARPPPSPCCADEHSYFPVHRLLPVPTHCVPVRVESDGGPCTVLAAPPPPSQVHRFPGVAMWCHPFAAAGARD